MTGIPLYSNATGIIPIVEPLIAKGVPRGTVPAIVILRKALKPQLITTLTGILLVSFICVG